MSMAYIQSMLPIHAHSGPFSEGRQLSEKLAGILEKMRVPRVLVVGDMILDRYVWGRAGRISQEAPIPVLSVDRREWRPGGAANVVANALVPLGVTATACGVVGGDEDGRLLSERIGELTGRRSRLVVDHGRPTTVKTRFIGYVQSAGRAAHQMLRVDEEDPAPIPPEVERQVLDFLESNMGAHDCLVVEDYDKGLLTPNLLMEVIGMAKSFGLPVVVDPAIRRSFDVYQGATALVPNRFEASQATGVAIADSASAAAAGDKLLGDLSLGYCLIKLDRDGMCLCSGSRRAMITNEPLDVYDVTGAGDTVTGVFGALVAAGADYEAAARIANVAAGIECGKLGCAPVYKDEILQALRGAEHGAGHKVLEVGRLKALLEERRARGERMAFTNGCFDLIHQGHIGLVKFARSQGDLLVVGVNSDRSVRALKGPTRPVLGQEERAAILSAFAEVDYVVIFDTLEVTPLIEELRPDVLVKGGDYSPDQVVGHEVVESYGGEVRMAPLVEGASTTNIVERVKELHQPEGSPKGKKRKGKA